MGIILGANQYGKAEIRVVTIDRDTPRHQIHDLSVTTTLQGDFAAAHESGDQSNVLPTDSQKNTVFAFAKERGVDQIEDFALDLARHFAETVPAVASARVTVDSYAWDRVGADGAAGTDSAGEAGGAGHDHSFVRRGQDVRTTTVTVGVTGHGPGAWVVSGIKDLVILKSTGSEFRGFFADRYTTLAETDDRILATSLIARWRYGEPAADWAKAHAGIRATILDAFATTHSRALQQSLQAMGTAVLQAYPEVAEIRFAAPNKHHFAADLTPFGLDNPGEVFYAADRPYGLIEATVIREDAPDPGLAWSAGLT
jgi:urate oxidase